MHWTQFKLAQTQLQLSLISVEAQGFLSGTVLADENWHPAATDLNSVATQFKLSLNQAILGLGLSLTSAATVHTMGNSVSFFHSVVWTVEFWEMIFSEKEKKSI